MRDQARAFGARRGSIAVIGAVAVLVSYGCGSAHRAGQPVGPDPYDVAAARACVALDHFVNDIKNHQPVEADSSAFDTTLKRLKSGHGPGARWSTLATDLGNFLIDGEYNNLADLGKDGLAAGQQCSTIPSAAKLAGGLT